MAYNQILFDKNNNLPNPDGYIKLTFEQYYDLMHHTHRMEDILNGEEDESVATLAQKVNELVDKVAVLEEENATLKTKVSKLEEESIDYTDYDIDKEGIQDIEGNTIDPDTGEIIAPAGEDQGTIENPDPINGEDNF